MPEGNHKTVAVQVWADVDEGVADMVRYLNTIPGVRTEASCQGTIGEGGPAPYPAQVMAHWPADAEPRLQDEFDVTPLGDGWGYLHPREGWIAPTPLQSEVAGLVAEARAFAKTAMEADAGDSERYSLEPGHTAHGLAANMITRLADTLTRTIPSVDAIGAAEQQVGQWVYLRIEALMDAKAGTPEADELQYLAAMAEEVEEYGISEVSGKDRPIKAPTEAPLPPARVELIKAHRVAFGSNLATAKLAVDEGWRPSVEPVLGEPTREELIEAVRGTEPHLFQPMHIDQIDAGIIVDALLSLLQAGGGR